jgi:hypothetical protein
VRDRSRKQENMKTPWTTYKTTHKKSEKTETQQTNTRTQNLFFCRLFVVCSLWLFLIFDIFWLRPCFGVCMGFMNHNTYIYICISYTCIYGNGEYSINCGQSRCDWSHSIGQPNIVSPWSESIA